MKLLLLFTTIFIGACFSNTKAQSTSPTVTYQTFYVDSLHTWVYDIRINNKIFIHQEYLPVVSGNVPFTTKEKAEKLALFVIDKIKQGAEFPAVTRQELVMLGLISE